jgi:hypothetical protein
MARKRRTEEELKKASDHLYYDIWMLNSMAGVLASRIAGKGPLENALLESFIVHMRALIDFLYPNGPKKDAVIAADFFNTQEEWEKLRPDQSEMLKKAKKRAHKEVAHLTYDRQKVTPEEKGWNFLEISQEIQEVIKIFMGNINKNILGSRWKESIS